MCGIVALWRPGGTVTTEQVVALCDQMAHRGPDSSGAVVLPGDRGGRVAELGLGHRRLAIIDLSPGGHQPMMLGDLAIVYNGEIYNYMELREELTGIGRTFRSASDTEVLLQAWAEWGPACLTRLNGIFAFVLWDASKGRLFAARDPLGVKPLHWAKSDGLLAFSSEAPLLAPFVAGSRTVDRAMARDFLLTGRSEISDESHFPGVHRLPAGSLMEAGQDNHEIQPYWSPSRANSRPANLSYEEASKTFHDLFIDAIRLQMRADVPVACCLSGGLDSSTVVSVAARRSPYRMSVFTARFADPTMDEWNWARVVHEESPVDPVEVHVDPRGYLENLGRVVRAQGEPFSTPSVYAQWAVMKAIAEKGIRVVLDGQGGDELLCGYAKFFYYGLLEEIRLGRWPSAIAWGASGLFRGGARLFDWAGARRYLPGVLGPRSLAERLLQPDLAVDGAGGSLARPGGGVREQQRLDLVRYSLPALLRFEDRNSMAHSVESRVPFLDPRLVEFCLDLPTEFKVRGAVSKRVLRDGMSAEVPARILARKSKLGFGGSFRSWVTDLAPDLLRWAGDRDRPVFRLVRPEAVCDLVRKADPIVFRVLAFDAWMSEYGMKW